MTPFDFDPSIRVVFGAGTLDQLGDLAKALAGQQSADAALSRIESKWNHLSRFH